MVGTKPKIMHRSPQSWLLLGWFPLKIRDSFQVVSMTQLIDDLPIWSINHPVWWFQPLWQIWKSVGIIILNIWKNVPNHQPASNYTLSLSLSLPLSLSPSLPPSLALSLSLPPSPSDQVWNYWFMQFWPIPICKEKTWQPLSYVVKPMINLAFGDGWNPTHLWYSNIGDDSWVALPQCVPS